MQQTKRTLHLPRVSSCERLGWCPGYKKERKDTSTPVRDRDRRICISQIMFSLPGALFVVIAVLGLGVAQMALHFG